MNRVNIAGLGKRLGVDVGGTYTDLVLLNGDADLITLKVPTTPSDPAQGVLKGIEGLGLDVSELEMIVHGSTIGVNTIIQRKGARTGLLTTEGFEDVLDIGTMSKPEMYNLFYRKPRPLVSREHRLGIRERMTFAGQILQEVEENDVVEKAQLLIDEGITSLAISTLHSYANAENEDRIARIVAERFPDLVLSVSHEIVNQRREFERTSTAVVNAYIAPNVAEYMTRLIDQLKSGGFSGALFIMKSNGGVMTAELARSVPVHTLLSGPVAGSIAGQVLGEAIESPNVITFDMGGTSCDISVILAGNPSQTFEAYVEGYPVMTPLVDIDYIGAGGGSIAKVIGDGSLRVGPESAGAVPGPAAYDKGGNEPTVTDANLVLGRLDPDGTLAGGIPLRNDLAEDAIRTRIADRLGMTVEQAALGIIDIACVKMAYAIRAATIEQGLDPRDFTLIAFGGAGPLHAGFIAQMVGVSRILVPWSPGTTCAWGMINTDLRHDVVRTVDYGGRQLDADQLNALFVELEDEGAETLIQQGVAASSINKKRSVDMRYGGQEHTLSIALPEGPVDANALAALRTGFDEAHQRRYAHSATDQPVEFVNVRVELVGVLEKPGVVYATGGPDSNGASPRIRTVVFREGQLEAAVYDRAALSPGARIDGPAVIEEDGSTTLLPPGFALTVDQARNMIVDVPEGQLL
jgi:N-methylhydantoinase A